jgi:hypothetical protein
MRCCCACTPKPPAAAEAPSPCVAPDLDADQGLVRRREKGETLRWQPITLDHAHNRGAIAATDQLLRYCDGRPPTTRRYDHLWKRIGDRLPRVAAQGIFTHWLRHTTLTWVERNFGCGIARAYAGHTDKTGPAATTCIKADLQGVATALAALTGQPHPLATSGGQAGIAFVGERPAALQRLAFEGGVERFGEGIVGRQLSTALIDCRTSRRIADDHSEREPSGPRGSTRTIPPLPTRRASGRTRAGARRTR